MRRKSVSVAMAAYNGEKFIQDQMVSILKQLKMEDELLISLDFSTDHTEEIVYSLAKEDKRIHIVQGPGLGAIQNFENAINLAKNEIIFLADQDDYWLPGKVDRVLKEFEDDNVKVVMHDASIVDENLNVLHESFFKYRKVRLGIRENILKNSYMGCCMAFTQELKNEFLPFPKRIPMHDQWIGLVGELTGKNVLIPEVYLLYRRHEDNETNLKHSGFSQMVKWRVDLYKEVEKFKKHRELLKSEQ